MTINSLDRLRNAIVLDHHAGPDQSELSGLFNDVECEVEEHYIELPRDKSGAPIHLGDKVRTKLGSTYKVSRITREDFEGMTTWYIEDFASHHSLGPEDLTLCKPPTVEDVLEDYRVKYYDLVTDMECKNITNEEYVQGIKELESEFAQKLQIRKED